VFGQAPLTFNGDVKHRIGYVPQQDDLLPNLTATNWLLLIQSFYPNWDKALQEKLLNDWDIPRNKRLYTLSVGQRQKVCIISGLCHRPDLLVLDEPVASLDPIARRQFLETLIALTRDNAPTIIFSTHIVSDVERIASRVWLMREGQIVIDSELDQLKEQFVRLHGPTELLNRWQPQFDLVHSNKHPQQQTIVIKNWDPTWQLETAIQVEHLGLEDIFVELHK
jgi:ABC-2 type transport system ATP-binding protein